MILTTHSMEEAEALSTKLSIMVEGQLQCYGSIPHIKMHYGVGYEIEVKVSIPREVLDERLGVEEKMVREEDVQEYLAHLQAGHLLKEITNDGVGQPLWIQIKQKNAISNLALGEWALTELFGSSGIQMLSESLLADLTVIEHFGAFYKLALGARIPLS